jgi:hypothetical protein
MRVVSMPGCLVTLHNIALALFGLLTEQLHSTPAGPTLRPVQLRRHPRGQRRHHGRKVIENKHPNGVESSCIPSFLELSATRLDILSLFCRALPGPCRWVNQNKHAVDVESPPPSITLLQGGARRPGHGDPAGAHLLGAEDDDPQGQPGGQARHHRHSGRGFHSSTSQRNLSSICH